MPFMIVLYLQRKDLERRGGSIAIIHSIAKCTCVLITAKGKSLLSLRSQGKSENKIRLIQCISVIMKRWKKTVYFERLKKMKFNNKDLFWRRKRDVGAKGETALYSEELIPCYHCSPLLMNGSVSSF